MPSFAVSVADGRMLDGREEIVFSVARSWYWPVPDLIITQRDLTLAAAADDRPR